MTMVTAVTIDPAQDVRAPLKDIYLVLLKKPPFRPNIAGRSRELSPVASLLLLAAVTTVIGGVIATMLFRSRRPAD